jgi:hypothetical protein
VKPDVLAVPHEVETGAGLDRIDMLELALCEHPNAIELEVEHVLTPGLYRRTLRAPRDTVATTYIHKQEHQFVVTRGVILVSELDGEPPIEVRAPYFGVTKKGTRRVCIVVEDAEWTTYHPVPEGMTNIDELEQYLFDFRVLPDGSNVRDRFRDALRAKALREGRPEEIEG